MGASPLKRAQGLKSTEGKTLYSYRFSTFTHPFWTELHSLWYVNVDGKNVKVLPKYLKLTAISLAYWLASDGSFNLRDNCIVISTESFTMAEVDRLRTLLLKDFNIESARNVHRPGYVIRIPKKEVGLPFPLKVQNLVKGIMPPSMKHRVGL